MRSIKRRIEALEKRERPERNELRQWESFLRWCDTSTLQEIAYGSVSEQVIEKAWSDYELQKSKKKN